MSAAGTLKTTAIVMMVLSMLYQVMNGFQFWALILPIILFVGGTILDSIDFGDTLTLMQEVNKKQKAKQTEPSKNNRRMKYLIAGFIVGFILIQLLFAFLPKTQTLEYGSTVPEVKPVSPAPEPVHEAPAGEMMNSTSFGAAQTIATLMPTMVIVVVFAVVIGVLLQIFRSSID